MASIVVKSWSTTSKTKDGVFLNHLIVHSPPHRIKEILGIATTPQICFLRCSPFYEIWRAQMGAGSGW